jgi:hypothetical protein
LFVFSSSFETNKKRKKENMISNVTQRQGWEGIEEENTHKEQYIMFG